MTKLLFGALAATIFGAALASPAAALTNDEIAMMSGPGRQAALEDGAKKEGQIVWYCTLIVDIGCRPISAGFEKKYPFIKTSYIPSPSAESMQRALTEKRANRVTVDIMQANGAGSLRGTGLAQKFTSPELAHYDPQMYDKEGEWVAIWSLANGLTWNTNRMPTAEAPKTWDALVDPKYKGKLYWASLTTSAPRMITHFRMLYGEEKAMDFLTKLRANDIRTVAGDAGSWVVGILSGEYTIFVGQPVGQIAPDKAKGAPVDGINPTPAATRTSAMAMMASAPHPYAAMLFVDFILSVPGQELLVASQHSPTRPGVPVPESDKWFTPTATNQKELVLTTVNEAEMHPRSQELYQQMFR